MSAGVAPISAAAALRAALTCRESSHCDDELDVEDDEDDEEHEEAEREDVDADEEKSSKKNRRTA